MLRLSDIPGDNYFFIHDNRTLETLVDNIGIKDLDKGKQILALAKGINEVEGILDLDELKKRIHEEIDIRKRVRRLHSCIFKQAISEARTRIEQEGMFDPNEAIQLDAIYYTITKSGLLGYMEQEGHVFDGLIMAREIMDGRSLQDIINGCLTVSKWEKFLRNVKPKFKEGLTMLYQGDTRLQNVLHPNYRKEGLYWLAKMFDNLQLKRIKVDRVHTEVAKLASRIQTDWIDGKIGVPQKVMTLFEDFGVECYRNVTRWDSGGRGVSLLYPNREINDEVLGSLYGLITKRKFDLSNQSIRIGTRRAKEQILALLQQVGGAFL